MLEANTFISILRSRIQNLYLVLKTSYQKIYQPYNRNILDEKILRQTVLLWQDLKVVGMPPFLSNQV